MMKRAVLYARVSKDDTQNDSRNLQGQLDMCRDYADAHGYRIVEELAEDDRGASGAVFDLPKLSQAITMARNGEYDILITRELDRFARKLSKQLIIEEELRRHGVTIEYVLGEYPDTPEGNLMKNVRATVAEYEREKIRERMNRGRIQKVKAGSVMTHGRAPYGYRLQEVGSLWNLEIYEPEAEIVRLIFAWYTEEKPGIIGVVRRLDDLKVPTYLDTYQADMEKRGEPKEGGRKIRGWGEWSRATVHHILTNRTYTGIWEYGKKKQSGTKRIRGESLISVDVPAIISEETWEATKAKLKYNRENSKRNLKHKYLLGKRVVCGDCKSKMVAMPNYTGKRIYFYYHCQAKRNFAKDCNNTVTYSAQSLDADVWDWVYSLMTDQRQLEIGLQEYQTRREEDLTPLRERAEIITQLIDNNQEQLNRLVDLYLSGQFDKEILWERKNRLETMIAGLEAEQKSIVNELEGQTLTEEQVLNIIEFAQEIAPRMDTDNFDKKRELIELLDVTVELNVENREKIAVARCFLGKKVLLVASKKSGMDGENRFPRLWRRGAESSSQTSAATT
jgi:site-specific DNA recombinase